MTQDRGDRMTERRNPRSAELDRVPIPEAFDIMQEEDRTVAEAVGRAKEEICAVVEAVAEAFERGGRLLYVGAGTSGRLGVLDAAECPPTFRSPRDQVQGILAGGAEALVRSVEGAEDSAGDGRGAVRERGVGSRDVVVGISAGGTTPYVRGALEEASRAGARTALLTCAEGGDDEVPADIVMRVLTGPEVLAGSTRLKAGTATKMVLNRISTLAMARIGKVFGNLMVDLDREACSKLGDRAVRIVAAATGLGYRASGALLEGAGDVKTAIVMHERGVGREVARRLLEEARGRLREALER
jgi:N-acetylmuramic acid 6-phosphate etherase